MTLKKIIRNGRWRFRISESVSDPDLMRKHLNEIDIFLEDGPKLKDSRSTSAAVREIPGCGRVFLKRTNNKGFRFTLRYLFRRARAFRAARAAERLLSCGVPTPAVLAVGEKRSFLYLHAGYLLTEAYEDAVSLAEYLHCSSDREAAIGKCIREGAALISRMHACGIVHGDCKFFNIYLRDHGNGECGTWDLDGAKWKPGLADEERMRDLARFSYSLVEEKIPLSGTEICAKVLASYQGPASMTAERLAGYLKNFAR